jgi:hypothetical protein
VSADALKAYPQAADTSEQINKPEGRFFSGFRVELGQHLQRSIDRSLWSGFTAFPTVNGADRRLGFAGNFFNG